MFIFIFSLLFTSLSSSFADTYECNNLTKAPTADYEFTQDFKIGSETYSIRKGPKYCYIDAKINKTYVMLDGCDSVIANPKTNEVSCVKGKKIEKLGQIDLAQILKKKKDEIKSSNPYDIDQCTEYLHREDRAFSANGKLINYPHRLNGNIEILESEVAGGRCVIKNDGKKIECDEVYKLSGNKVECVHGYLSSKVTGVLSDGTTLPLSELLDSKINLCAKEGRFLYQRKESADSSSDPKSIDIQICKLMGDNDRSCKAIWLTETGLECEPVDGHKNCEPTKDNPKPCELIKISKGMRADIYSQVLGDQNITVKRIRELMNNNIFVPKNPDFFDETTLKGEPSIKLMGNRRSKTSQ